MMFQQSGAIQYSSYSDRGEYKAILLQQTIPVLFWFQYGIKLPFPSKFRGFDIFTQHQ